MQKNPNKEGSCEHCNATFPYALIHNGFNDSVYAYCACCGLVAFISAWDNKIPLAANFKAHKVITEEMKLLIKPCSCGGSFSNKASPRCPSCKEVLDPYKATKWIEKDAPGTAKGWRWQGNWFGLYAIIIDNKSAELEWRD